MNDSVKRVPELRLSGFEGEWGIAQAKNIFNEVTQKGFTDLPVLSATQDQGMIVRNRLGKIIQYQDGAEATYKRVQPGDFVVHLRSFQGGFAHSDVEGVTSPAYTVFRATNKDEHDDRFWKYMFLSDAFIVALEKVTYGIRDGRSISFSEFMESVVSFPAVDEQQAISGVIDRAGQLIESAARRVEALQHLRQTMLVKMFPRGDAREPEIRFSGFKGEWERKPLQQCFSERVQFDDQEELLSVSIGSGVERLSETGRRDTSNTTKSNYKLVEVDDIAYNSMRMWQGASGRSPYRGIVSPAYTVLIPAKGVHSGFFARMFKNPGVIATFQKNSQGISSDTWNLKYPALSQIEIRQPSMREQRSISEMFDRLDELIDAESTKVEKLRHLRSALLEKMFV